MRDNNICVQLRPEADPEGVCLNPHPNPPFLYPMKINYFVLICNVMLAVGTAKRFFKLSEISITATAFVILINSGIQLKLVSIHDDGHFFLNC